MFKTEIEIPDNSLAGIPFARSDDDSQPPSVSDTSEHASTNTNSSHHFDSDARDFEKLKQMKIAVTEEKQVKIIRAVTFSFITFSAIAVCVMVFIFAKDYDKNEFEIEYQDFVQTIQNDVVWEVKYNFALLQQLSGIITSEILTSNQTAPFITMPNFEVTGGYTDGMGSIMNAMFAPLVLGSLREQWEAYSVEHQGWLNQSAMLKVQHKEHLNPLKGTVQDHETNFINELEPCDVVDTDIDPIPEKIWRWEGDVEVVLDPSPSGQVLAPLWQTSPANSTTINVDLFSDSRIVELYDTVTGTNQPLMSSSFEIESLMDWMFLPGEEERKEGPHAFIIERVFADFTPEAEPIGFVAGLTSYRHLFENILAPGTPGIYCVVTGSGACGSNFTFLLEGPEATFIGFDHIEEWLEEYEVVVPVEIYDTVNEDVCVHELHIYPSRELQASHATNKAGVYTGVIALAFAVTTFCFMVYERLVTKREKTKSAALQVVSSLFPSDVQDKVLKGVHEGVHGTPKGGNMIASFFPNTTVIFADIAGFTAWSSTREPEQVFHLLETVYGAMDQIAVKRGIFKVETVGDCYVAVCGLPEARVDHAIAMTRFARDCQLRMASLSQQLEVALGPDTADLSFRIGMHSGPVMGGVLRGKNARFQLFGDTMNQASRMESTGIKSRIQMSATTAQLLIDGGKGKWLEKRPDKVDVKGKGLQQTYFYKLSVTRQETASVASMSEEENKTNGLQKSIEKKSSGNIQSLEYRVPNKTQRLITWNTAVLSRRVKGILQSRSKDVHHVELSKKVADQLYQYIYEIALMYRDNPFHNYEHASHVTLSMEKMLSRVEGIGKDSNGEVLGNRYTNDITTDPLAQFAVVYAALVHDVDHTGASNNQLVKEQNPVAIKYHGKSPAENNSIDLAWSTLMKPEFKDLVKCICQTSADKDRLKKLVINAVLATDIFDESLKESRNMRWEHVFGENTANKETILDENLDSLKVKIVLEHLIQASDVAHTMQHWHVYIKWNERLFHEMNDAYHNGRLGMDPSQFWYKGELGFFDFYVIPLAKKLRECGVFGVSCDEFLNYAETNRSEWEAKGQAIVKEYTLQVGKKKDVSTKSATFVDPVPTKPDRISRSPAA